MGTRAQRKPRQLSDLTERERARLEAADRRLQNAVEKALSSDDATLRSANAKIDTAEEELWRLRAELLGWIRPTWAPRASLVADWFSEEDKIYDDIEISR